jgi:hypothetical protein
LIMLTQLVSQRGSCALLCADQHKINLHVCLSRCLSCPALRAMSQLLFNLEIQAFSTTRL